NCLCLARTAFAGHGLPGRICAIALIPDLSVPEIVSPVPAGFVEADRHRVEAMGESRFSAMRRRRRRGKLLKPGKEPDLPLGSATSPLQAATLGRRECY